MDVEIRLTDKGKGLFALKNFKNEVTIFEEDPLVCAQFSWNAAYKYRACDHCLKPLETAEENARRLTGKIDLVLPYSECCSTDQQNIAICSMCGVEYCSAKCLSAAYNQYHKTLCLQTKERNNVHPLEILNEAWKHVHYPPETSTIMLVIRLLARIKQSPDPNAAIEQALQFCHRSVNEDKQLAHKMLGEKFVDQLSLLHNLLIQAVPHEGIEHLLTESGFQTLLALIGTNGQGVGTSAISQWVMKTSDLPLSDDDRKVLDDFIDQLYNDTDRHVGNFLNNEGVALYSLQSSCNHSCLPNVEAAFLNNNSQLSLVALRDIQEGEELFISYLDECNLHRSRHSRRKELMENYIFKCKCEKCIAQADEPDVTSDEDQTEDEQMSD